MLRRLSIILLCLSCAFAAAAWQDRPAAPHALLVVGDAPASVADRAVRDRLEKLGFTVTVRPARGLSPQQLEAQAVILVSASAPTEALPQQLGSVAAPLVTWHPDTFARLGMTGVTADVDSGVSTPATTVTVTSVGHRMAAGLAGPLTVATQAVPLSWGLPGPEAVWVASISGDANRAALFGCEEGAGLVPGGAGVPARAPARRVALPFAGETWSRLTPTGWTLFDAAVRWASVRNQAPIVSAGPDQQATLPEAATLAGRVSDDGVPEGHGREIVWSLGSGPAPVRFDDAGAMATRVRFSQPGRYVLRLRGSDGLRVAEDEAEVLVTGRPDSTPKAALATSDAEVAAVPSPRAPALLVVGGTPTAGDNALRTHLESRNYQVTAKASSAVVAADVGGKKVVVVTGTSGPLPAGFGDLPVPLVAMKATLFGPLGLTGNTTNSDIGNTSSATLTISDPTHLLAAGLQGTVTVVTPAQLLPWGVPGRNAAVAAVLPGTDHAASFGYLRGVSMFRGVAPARRVGLFVSDFAAPRLSTDGWRLFDASVDWAAGLLHTPPQVDAGANARTAVGVRVTLAGTASDDGAPNLGLTTMWSVVDGPGGPSCVSFDDPSAVDTAVAFCQAGEFRLRLSADDGGGAVSDDVFVSVEATNAPPVLEIEDPGNIPLSEVAVVTGTVTDDGIPTPPGRVDLEWSLASGPGRAVFGFPHDVNTTIAFSAPGKYKVRLTASDGAATAVHEITISVGGQGRRALLVVGREAPLSPGDALLWERMQGAGLSVRVRPVSDFTEADALTSSLVVVSSTAGAPPALGSALRAASVPVVVLAPGLFDDLGMSGAASEADWGVLGNQVELSVASPAHPLAARLTSIVNVSARPGVFGWVVPAPGAASVFSLVDDASRAVVFGYVEGAAMVGTTAPARRVGVGLGDATLAGATEGGLALVDAALSWALEVNLAPTVHAGLRRTARPGVPLALAGVAGDDGLPAPPGALTVSWSLVSGPGTATFADASQAQTSVAFSDPGGYVLRLRASDGEAVSEDTVTVSVSAVNQAPVVDAGLTRMTRTPGTVTLRGGASDDGLPAGRALAYAWSMVSGPGAVTFGTPGAPQTTATCRASGRYVLRLTVSDGALSGTAETALTCGATALLVVGGPDLTAGEAAIRSKLESLGQFVVVSKASAARAADADGRTLVWLSAAAAAADLLDGRKFAGVTAPVVSTSSALFNGMGLTGGTEGLQRGTTPDQTRLRLPVARHILSAGLEGLVPFAAGSGTVSWGVPTIEAIPVAGLEAAPGRLVIFAYEQGARMALMNAPGRRVAFGLEDDALTRLTPGAAELLDTALRWALRADIRPHLRIAAPRLVRAETTVSLVGTVLDDGLPNPPGSTTVTWDVAGDPTGVRFGDPHQASTTVSFATKGDYVLRLTASDGAASAVATAAVAVLERDATNAPPVIDIVAPPSRSLELRLPQRAHLEAAVSDDGLPEGAQVSVSWTLASGPGGRVVFSNPSGVETDVSFPPPLVPGVYVLRMIASDGETQSAADVTLTAAPPRHALLVVGSVPLVAEDQAARTRLEERGYEVAVVEAGSANAGSAAGQDLVLISATVNSIGLAGRFRQVPQPVIAWEQGVFLSMGMTGPVAGTDFGVELDETRIAVTAPDHTLAAGLSGIVTVNTHPGEVRWGIPAGAGVTVATLVDDGSKATVFAFAKGAALRNGAPAAGRRVGMFVRPDILGTDGWRLFDAAVEWLAGP